MKKVKQFELRLFSFKLKSLYFIIFLSLIFLIAFLVRSLSLTKLPVFADEAIYIRWAQVMRAEQTLRFLPLSDGKQPLFMWAAIPFLKLFVNPLFAGRFLSVVTGLLTLLGIVIVSRRLFKSERIALITAVFYAISPFSVFFDRMALVDSMLAMFGIWTFYFFLMSIQSLRFDYAMLAGFSLGGALLTKSPALFYVILLPSVFLFVDFKVFRRFKLIYFLKLLSYLITTYVIGYGMFNILRLGPNFQMLSSRNLDYVYPISHVLTSPLNPLFPHLVDVFVWLRTLGPFVILFFILGGLVWAVKEKRRDVLVLVVWAFIPIITQAEYAKVFTARYILFSVPFLCVISPLAFKLRGFAIRVSYLVLLILFILLSSYQVFWFIVNPERAYMPRNERGGYLEEWTAGTGIREIADYLIQEYKNNPNENIVVGTEGYFGTLPDGLQIYLNSYPQITVVGLGVDFREVPKELVNSAQSGTKTYLVVNSSRNLITNKDRLSIIGSFQKAERPDGTRDELQFYRLE